VRFLEEFPASRKGGVAENFKGGFMNHGAVKEDSCQGARTITAPLLEKVAKQKFLSAQAGKH
jgi:hypothetical protein